MPIPAPRPAGCAFLHSPALAQKASAPGVWQFDGWIQPSDLYSIEYVTIEDCSSGSKREELCHAEHWIGSIPRGGTGPLDRLALPSLEDKLRSHDSDCGDYMNMIRT